MLFHPTALREAGEFQRYRARGGIPGGPRGTSVRSLPPATGHESCLEIRARQKGRMTRGPSQAGLREKFRLESRTDRFMRATGLAIFVAILAISYYLLTT